MTVSKHEWRDVVVGLNFCEIAIAAGENARAEVQCDGEQAVADIHCGRGDGRAHRAVVAVIERETGRRRPAVGSGTAIVKRP